MCDVTPWETQSGAYGDESRSGDPGARLRDEPVAGFDGVVQGGWRRHCSGSVFFFFFFFWGGEADMISNDDADD